MALKQSRVAVIDLTKSQVSKKVVLQMGSFKTNVYASQDVVAAIPISSKGVARINKLK